MDGDERRSGATAVCDGGTEDEAVASGDVAPAAVTDEHESADDASTAGGSVDAAEAGAPDDDGVPEEPEAAASPDVPPEVSPEVHDSPPEAVAPDGAESDDVTPDGAVADDAAPDGAAADEQAAADDDVPSDDDLENSDDSDDRSHGGSDGSSDGSELAAVAATDPAPAAQRRRLRPYLRRGALALVAAGFVALAVGAFSWAAPSPAGADQQFVDAAHSQGHVVVPGEQQTLVVSAARKICDRRVLHDTDQERRATALTTDEIAAVGTAFGADTRDFTTLALETYCSS